jgi:hypothetical protein
MRRPAWRFLQNEETPVSHSIEHQTIAWRRPHAMSLSRRTIVASGMQIGGAAAIPVIAQTTCHPSYADFCIAPAYEVGDLDCANSAAGWFTVLPPDPHGFDADYDGYGCESN